MKALLTFLKWLFLSLVIVVGGLYIFVQLSWHKTYDPPYPEITASTDSAVIARGEYLVHGPAHCVYCHSDPAIRAEIDKGFKAPLQGGWELSIPPGTFRAPNLTSDPETGIGGLTDGEVARVLRHMVGADGRMVPPFMPFAEISQEDLTAILSYLRTQPPVKNVVPRTEYSLIGKAIQAFGLMKPEGTKGNPPVSVEIAPTIEYGEYLANYVADCNGCHTERSMKDGSFIGEKLAGGGKFPADNNTKGWSFQTPNLTPDSETGVIAKWSEQQFIDRFRNGRIHENSPMPWGAYSRMTEVDLQALYRYLHTLEPVYNKVEKTVWSPDEEVPFGP